MLSTMRKNTKQVLWILVFAFIGTIIFSWGMGGFKGSFEPGVLGKVNGVKISRDYYDQSIQSRFEYERQNTEGGELTADRADRVRAEVWEGLINEILIKEAREDAGIYVTDREVAYAVRQSPPQAIVNNPSFRDSTGMFNWQLYNMIISDPSNEEYVIELEASVRQQLLQQRLLQRVGSIVHVSDQEAREEYKRANHKARGTYILVDASKMAVDSSLVTEAEMRREYTIRKDEFILEETRTLEAVTIPNIPSREDTIEVKNLIEDLKLQIENGASFATLADEYSEDPSVATNHGDLGWYGKNKMEPPFEKASFNASKGDLVGPIATNRGYHLIKLNDRRVVGGNEEVNASHILIKVEQSPQTLDDIRAAADGFRDEVEESGFVEAARIFNLELDTLANIKKGAYIPGLGRNNAASDFLFGRPKGEASPIYSTQRGDMMLMRVIEVTKESVKPFEEVKDVLLNDLLMDARFEVAKSECDKVYAAYSETSNLDSAAARTGYSTRTQKREFKYGDYMAGIARDYNFQVASFKMNEGDVSEPVLGDKGYFVIHLDYKEVTSDEQWETDKEEFMVTLVNRRQQEYFGEWILKARDEAKIEDNRYLYFTKY
jgi:parvulin-like peptidyl-prolyl isomerase